MSAQKGTIVVTGANGGLGAAIVADIISRATIATDYAGIYTVRNIATASNLNSALKDSPKSHKHEILEAEFLSLESTRKLAATINAKVTSGDIPPIRALILNAGFQDKADINLTEDGYESIWQVNFLANQILSLMLMQSMDKEHGRILIIGSWAHDVHDQRNYRQGFKPFQDTKWHQFPGAEALARGKFSSPAEDNGDGHASLRRYGYSKLCAVMMMHELAIRCGNDPSLSNISILGIDPGGMPSDFMRNHSFMNRVVVRKFVLPIVAPISTFISPNGDVRTPSKSAGDIMELCFNAKPPKKGNALYVNGTKEMETAVMARDPAKRKEVWESGIQAADIKPTDTILVNWK